MRIEINVLGPLDVSIGGVSIVPTASKPSRLLAMLALNAGNVVTTTALTAEIWDRRPPPSGVPTLRTYVLKLRRMLDRALAGEKGTTSKDILITRRSGYLLDVAPSAVDAIRYDQLSVAGHDAVNNGDHEAASRKLGEALRLWRGPVLADVAPGPQLGIEAMRLEETRLGDLYLRIAADLRLSRHHQLLGELATLCARHPLLENFCAQQMIALYRCGRQSEALDAFRRLRTNMVEQLGVEPSIKVRRLHHGILTGHTSTDEDDLVFNG